MLNVNVNRYARYPGIPSATKAFLLGAESAVVVIVRP
jgi:hypothetical protein